jgi:hypothetical protein
MLSGWFAGFTLVAGVMLVSGAALILIGVLVSFTVRAVAAGLILFVALLAFPLVLNAAIALTGNQSNSSITIAPPTPASR